MVIPDISKAYDCIKLTKLGGILLKCSIPFQIHLWTLYFTSKRVFAMGANIVEVYTAKLHDFQDKTSVFQYADDFLIV